jgi:8-amino-7-oxononanoate synthase
MWNGLIERGVYVNLMLPPATPKNVCLLRCSVSAAHTTEQIGAILEAFSALQDGIVAVQATG